MFIEKDNRKILEIVYEPKEKSKLLFARRGPEFETTGTTAEVFNESTAQYFSEAKYLNLYDNKLKQIKGLNYIAQFGKLEEVNFGRNNLDQLPRDVGTISSLRKLWAEDCRFTTFPSPILKLTNLTQLRLSGNQINLVPESISVLSKLEDFGIDGNGVSSLPESLGQLSELRLLQVRGNALTALPESIGQLHKLAFLSVTTNSLRRLPRSIGSCTSLSTLQLNCNALVTLPASLAQCKGLRRVNVNNNALQFLPLALVDAWAASLTGQLSTLLTRAPFLLHRFACTLAAGGQAQGGRAELLYYGHAGKQGKVTVQCAQGWREALAEATGGTVPGLQQQGEQGGAGAGMEVDGGEGRPGQGLWLQDIREDMDLRPLLQAHGWGTGGSSSSSSDGMEVEGTAAAAAVPAPLPSCLHPDTPYTPGLYATSPSSPPLPPFNLTLDVNPLLHPACGVHSVAGGDIGTFTYAPPLVYELKRRVEEKAAREARAKGKGGGAPAGH